MRRHVLVEDIMACIGRDNDLVEDDDMVEDGTVRCHLCPEMPPDHAKLSRAALASRSNLARWPNFRDDHGGRH